MGYRELASAMRYAPCAMRSRALRPGLSGLANHAWAVAGLRPLRPWPEALAAMLEAWRRTRRAPGSTTQLTEV